MKFRKRYVVGLLAFLLLLYFFHVITIPKVFPQDFYSPEASELPFLMLSSLARMFAAFVLALVFSLAYGFFAATTRWRKLLLAVLDVLQSIPVLGFFPVAILVLINFFNGSLLGLELASVFLIFTSMAWNMTFGVYESISTVPSDLVYAANSFGLKGWKLFKKVFLPACVPKLVYNSIMSWTNGWYFLIACEIISIGGKTYALRGIGTFLVRATSAGRIDLAFAGLLVLVSLILLLELLVWRHLQVWATNFRYESFSRDLPTSTIYKWYRWMPAFSWFKRSLNLFLGECYGVLRFFVLTPLRAFGGTRFGKFFFWLLKNGLFFGLGGVLAWFLFLFTGFLLEIFSKPLPEPVFGVPAAIFFSFLRLSIAFVLSLLWTVPAAVFVWRSKRLKKFLLPFFEVCASIPATALFPLMVLFVVGVTGSVDVAAVLLVLTGMQWYLFFNVFAGLNSIPEDLIEAAESFGVKGALYWRKVLLPAIAPSIVTGSVSAWGGGWNALIVAEYFVYSGLVYSVSSGIGSTIDYAVYARGDMTTLFFALVGMIVFIMLINFLVWRRVYDYVCRKCKVVL